MEINSDLKSKIETLPSCYNSTKTKFKLHQKKIFLTYSAKIHKQDLINHIDFEIGTLKEFCVCWETYTDLDANDELRYHTHVLLHFTKQPCITCANKFDYLNIHPNIRRINTLGHYTNCVKYCYKEDESPFTNIELVKHNTINNQDIINIIKEQKSFLDVLQHKDLINICKGSLNWMKEIYNHTRQRAIPKSILTIDTLYKYQLKLFNLLQNTPKPREIFWCWSAKPNVGKTEFIKFLQNNHFSVIFGTSKLDDLYFKYNNEDIIVFNISFAKSKILEGDLIPDEDGEYHHIPHLLSVFETLSDKASYDTYKYQGASGVINSHLLIFSNVPAKLVKPLLPQRIVEIVATREKQDIENTSPSDNSTEEII